MLLVTVTVFLLAVATSHAAPAETTTETTTVTSTVSTITITSAEPVTTETASAATTKAKVPEPLETNETQEPPKPVHERFPHAVLFGGTCGGSIIGDTWVLTAAHCTLSGSSYVLAGTNVTYHGHGVRVPVKRLVIHPRFSVGPYWVDADKFGIKQVGARYDFLLVELKRPLPLNGVNISVIPLQDETSVPVGLDADYAGYGAVHHGQYMQRTMHAMELSVAADATCANKMVEFDSEDMLCTKGRPPRFDSACNGDSGSGLVGDGRLLGVASWVEDDAITCRPGALVVFSRVSRVRDWIRNVTGI